MKKGEYIYLQETDFIYFVKKLKVEKMVLNYFIDPEPKYTSNPEGGDRICIFTITNLEMGKTIRKIIYNHLFSYNNRSWRRTR